MLQPDNRARVFARRPVLDVVLELVDLVVEAVDQVEVPLGDLVDEVVRVHPDALVGVGRPPWPVEMSNGSPSFRRVLRTVSRPSRVPIEVDSW